MTDVRIAAAALLGILVGWMALGVWQACGGRPQAPVPEKPRRRTVEVQVTDWEAMREGESLFMNVSRQWQDCVALTAHTKFCELGLDRKTWAAAEERYWKADVWERMRLQFNADHLVRTRDESINGYRVRLVWNGGAE